MLHRFRAPQTPASIAAPSTSGSHKFARPPSGTHVSKASSPGHTSGHHSQSRVFLKDEIETPLDEDDWPSTTGHAGRQLRERGYAPLADSSPSNIERPSRLNYLDISSDEDHSEDPSLYDLGFLERFRGTHASRPEPESETAPPSSSDEDPLTLLFEPSRKRRRVTKDQGSHVEERKTNDRILDVVDAADDICTPKKEKHLWHQHSKADSLPSSPLLDSPTPKHNVTSTVTGRFKFPPQTSPWTAAPLPFQVKDLNRVSQRPHFVRHGSLASTEADLAGLNLPPAFSPSRRGRGRDRSRSGDHGDPLLPGGAAASTRGWILSLGASVEEQGNRRTQLTRTSARDWADNKKRVPGWSIQVAHVISRIMPLSPLGQKGDQSTLLQDIMGKKWVLVGPAETSSPTMRSVNLNGTRLGGCKKGHVEAGDIISVKLGWEMDLGFRIHSGKDSGRALETTTTMTITSPSADPARRTSRNGRDVWNFAVLWDMCYGTLAQ